MAVPSRMPLPSPSDLDVCGSSVWKCGVWGYGVDGFGDFWQNAK